MNTITINGNVGKDPELRFNSAGMPVCKVSVASRYKPKNGEEETTWFNVVVFGEMAEHCAESLSKGVRVLVSGRFRKKKWTKDDGTEVTTDEVLADSIAVDLRFQTADISKAGKSKQHHQVSHDDEEPF